MIAIQYEVFMKRIRTYSVTQFVLKETDEPIEGEEGRTLIELLKLPVDIWQEDPDQILSKVMAIGLNTNQVAVVVHGQDPFKKHSKDPEGFLFRQLKDDLAQYEVHTLAITNHRIPKSIGNQDPLNRVEHFSLHKAAELLRVTQSIL